MGIQIADTASLAKKFATRAGQASGDYKDGVARSGNAWETNTKASEDNYKLSVVQAANEGRFGKGVSAAGQAKFLKRATELGPSRFTAGVGAAQEDWARGVQPSLDALKSLDLPPRRPKGENGNRADIVAKRLRAVKLGK